VVEGDRTGAAKGENGNKERTQRKQGKVGSTSSLKTTATKYARIWRKGELKRVLPNVCSKDSLSRCLLFPKWDQKKDRQGFKLKKKKLRKKNILETRLGKGKRK